MRDANTYYEVLRGIRDKLKKRGARLDAEDVEWITANGNHIPIDPETKNPVGGQLKAFGDYEGVHESKKPSIKSALEKAYRKFPQIKDAVKGVEMVDTDFAGFKEHPNAVSLFGDQSQKIFLNKNLFGNDSDELKKRIEEGVKSGKYPKGATEEHVIAHEIGHALARYIDLIDFDPFSESVVDTIYKKVFEKYSMEDIESGLSKYAAKNPKELIAEGVAEYITSDKPRGVASYIGKTVEDIIQEKNH